MSSFTNFSSFDSPFLSSSYQACCIAIFYCKLLSFDDFTCWRIKVIVLQVLSWFIMSPWTLILTLFVWLTFLSLRTFLLYFFLILLWEFSLAHWSSFLFRCQSILFSMCVLLCTKVLVPEHFSSSFLLSAQPHSNFPIRMHATPLLLSPFAFQAGCDIHSVLFLLKHWCVVFFKSWLVHNIIRLYLD